MNKKVQITTDYITLGQLLKFENVISNGSEAKAFVLNHKIIVNGEPSNQRGKKLYPSTTIAIDDSLFFEIIK
jgi:ribosome-associated protein